MKIPIHNCKYEFSFECPKDWNALAETANPLVRNCDQCQKDVYFCDTVQTAKHMASKGFCVAIDPEAEEVESDCPRPKRNRGRIRLGNLKP